MRDTKTIDSQFLRVPCKIFYNCILGQPFATTLNAIAFPLYLKLKYQNMHDESTIINTDLSGAKMIYKDQKEDKAKDMEINVTSLIG